MLAHECGVGDCGGGGEELVTAGVALTEVGGGLACIGEELAGVGGDSGTWVGTLDEEELPTLPATSKWT